MPASERGGLRRDDGATVADLRQAIAMPLGEAGASDRVTPEASARHRRRTRREDTLGLTPRALHEGRATRAALHGEARRRDLPGRSTLPRAELRRGRVG